MRQLKFSVALAGAIASLLAFAIACASTEEPAPPSQPAAPQPAAQARQSTVQPGPAQQPQQPAAPQPAPTAVLTSPVIAEPIIPATRTTSAPMQASDADTNIFSADRFGGSLVWVPQGSVGNLDSMTSGSAIGRGVSWHFWESLAQWDSQGFINPDMADNWEVDGGTYTFTLRDDLTWHDGSQVLPEDVGASIERFRMQDRSFSPVLNNIWVGFEEVDDKTFQDTA